MTEFSDRPPPGWFSLDVVRRASRKWDWVALMVEADPDLEIKKRYRPIRGVWIQIPGKHRNLEAALLALEDMLATRH